MSGMKLIDKYHNQGTECKINFYGTILTIQKNSVIDLDNQEGVKRAPADIRDRLLVSDRYIKLEGEEPLIVETHAEGESKREPFKAEAPERTIEEPETGEKGNDSDTETEEPETGVLTLHGLIDAYESECSKEEPDSKKLDEYVEAIIEVATTKDWDSDYTIDIKKITYQSVKDDISAEFPVIVAKVWNILEKAQKKSRSSIVGLLETYITKQEDK